MQNFSMSLLIVPTEVLMKILSYDSVSISDLFRLMNSCSELCFIIRHSNDLWRQKFTARWPRIHFQEDDKTAVLWLERICLRMRLGKEVEAVIQSMSPLCYPRGAKVFTPQCVVDKLVEVVNENPQFVEDEISHLTFESKNLTTQYYARHLLKKVRTLALEKKWLDFNTKMDINALPESKETIWVEGSLLITQWLNMEEKDLPSFNVLDAVFNQITQRVRNLVLDTSENRQILSIISHVLFDEDEMNFLALRYEDFDSFSTSSEFDRAVHSFCIDKVLLARGRRECHWTILCIIYQEVARRMGIHCEPVCCVGACCMDSRIKDYDDSDMLFLRWQEFSKEDDGKFTYINILDKGSLKRPNLSGRIGPYIEMEETVYHRVKSSGSAVSVDGVLRLMLNHFVDYANSCKLPVYRQLKYMKLASVFFYKMRFLREDIANRLRYFDTAIIYALELDDALKRLQSYDDEDFTADYCMEKFGPRCRDLLIQAQADSRLPVVPKYRSPTLKYAVGLVMNSRKLNLETNEIKIEICVIVSWEVKPRSRGQWDKLRPESNQPRYKVLTTSGDEFNARYYYQDELELHPDSASVQFNHTELGLHFEKFDGRRFVPNAVKKRHFPKDEAVALSLTEN